MKYGNYIKFFLILLIIFISSNLFALEIIHDNKTLSPADNNFTFAVVNAYILFDGKLLICNVKNADNWADDILYIFNVVNILKGKGLTSYQMQDLGIPEYILNRYR